MAKSPSPSGSPCSSSSAAVPPPPPYQLSATVSPLPRHRFNLHDLVVQKHIGWALLMFNALYCFALFLFSQSFADIVVTFRFFWLAYALSLAVAVFAIKCHIGALLVPLVVTLVPFVLVPLLICALFLAHLLCTAIPHGANSTQSFPFLQDCPPDVLAAHDGNPPIRIAPKSASAIFVLTLVMLEKCAELLFFRNLMRRLAKQSGENVVARCARQGQEARSGGGGGTAGEGNPRKRKKAKRQSIEQNMFESPVEERSDEGTDADEEETVYDNKMHREPRAKVEGRRTSSTGAVGAPSSRLPVPTVGDSKRVIA